MPPDPRQQQQQQQQPPPQEFGRVFLIIILIIFIYTSPDQSTPLNATFPTPHDYALERAHRARHNLDILNSTHWQDFAPRSSEHEREKGEDSRYLNLTGFRESDGYKWERLGAFRKRGEGLSAEARGREGVLLGEVWENVTGIVVGRWRRVVGDLDGERERRGLFNLSEISPGIEWAFRDQEFWSRNVTGEEGKLTVRVREREGRAREMVFDGDAEGREKEKARRDVGLDDVEKRDVEKMTIEKEKTRSKSWYTDVVRQVEAEIVIQDESSSGDGWDMKVHGVHWPRKGVMVMTTTSEKFAGIFGLPHLTADADQFRTSQKLLNKTLEPIVEGMEKATWYDDGNPWTATPTAQGDATFPAPHCEFVLYAQVYPIGSGLVMASGDMLTKAVHDMEQELRYPNGAPIARVPEMKMSAVLFSPDCGFMLESKGPPTFAPADGKHLIGKKQEVWLGDLQSWLHIFALVLFAQLMLLKVQSKEASTPSTVGRVSLYTMSMMLVADALMFATMSLITSGMVNSFPSALLASFAALLSVFFGVRFIANVYRVQEPERLERMRARQAVEAAAIAARAGANPTPPVSTPIAVPIITAAGADIPVPAQRPVPQDIPIIIPSDQDIDAEIAENLAAPTLPTTNTPANATQLRSSNFTANYFKSVGVIVLILFVSAHATTWPVTARNVYLHVMSFTYLSFWIPQIYRNVVRNCRKALLWKFIIGQSLCRLLPFAYFYLRADNVLFADTDWKAFCVLAGWVWIQIWILVAQEVLGPRWGLPKHWTNEGWDYHPILREDNVESGGLPIGLVQIPGSPTLERANTGDESGRKKRDGNVRSVDCAICMQVLEVPVVPAGEEAGGSGTGVAGMLARRFYMVTPCRHVFHSACLEGWMRFRLQCPICRENLPPL